MKNFEEYEAIALESKKMLFDAYVKGQKLEEEYKKKVEFKQALMFSSGEIQKWKN